jgi:hypothetical protein
MESFVSFRKYAFSYHAFLMVATQDSLLFEGSSGGIRLRWLANSREVYLASSQQQVAQL